MAWNKWGQLSPVRLLSIGMVLLFSMTAAPQYALAMSKKRAVTYPAPTLTTVAATATNTPTPATTPTPTPATTATPTAAFAATQPPVSGVASIPPLEAPFIYSLFFNTLPADPSLTTVTPDNTVTPTPTPTATPAPYVYQKGEVSELQKILNLSLYLGTGVSASEVMTDELDAPTTNAIRQYLATLNADPNWTRDYLTKNEYAQLLVLSSATPPMATLPTPSPSPAPTATPTPVITPSGSPTPTLQSIMITSPTLPPEGGVLSIALPLTDGLRIEGLAQPENEITLTLTAQAQPSVRYTVKSDAHGAFEGHFSSEELDAFDGAKDTCVTVDYLSMPDSFWAKLPIDYQTAREGNVKLVAVAFTHRNTDLSIQGQVAPADIPVWLQNSEGVILAQALADSDGQFTFHLKNAMAEGKPVTDQYSLVLNGDEQRPETIRVRDVKQETLFAFTRSLQTQEVLLIGVGLFVLGMALLVTCMISRRLTNGRRKKNRPVQGGEPRD